MSIASTPPDRALEAGGTDRPPCSTGVVGSATEHPKQPQAPRVAAQLEPGDGLALDEDAAWTEVAVSGDFSGVRAPTSRSSVPA